jgi:hypothetical protein
LQARIDAAKKGQVHQIKSFTSTSVGDKIQHDFEGNAYTQFHNVVGKNVSSISAFPHEKEFLILPTQMQWTGVKVDQTTGVVYLKGRPVSTPDYAHKTSIVEAHNEFSEHISEVLKKMNKELPKSRPTWITDGQKEMVNRESELKQIAKEIRNIDDFKKEFEKKDSGLLKKPKIL